MTGERAERQLDPPQPLCVQAVIPIPSDDQRIGLE